MSELRKTYECGVVFVTITVEGWIDVFIRPEYAEELIKNLQYCQWEKGLLLYGYCLQIVQNALLSLAAATDKRYVYPDVMVTVRNGTGAPTGW